MTDEEKAEEWLNERYLKDSCKLLLKIMQKCTIFY